MNKQMDNIEQLFQVAQNAEPDLSDQFFTDAVMQQVREHRRSEIKTRRAQNVFTWLVGLVTTSFVISFFPTVEIIQALTIFAAGVTLSQVIVICLVMSAIAYGAYWAVEADAS